MALGQLQGSDQADEDRDEVDEALAAFGLVADRSQESPRHDEFYLWPENLAALLLFNEVQTQWQIGPLGPTGLNYPGVRASPAFERIAPVLREEVLDGACVMERAYLAALAENDRARRRR